jgi:ankyrin repeat protein
MIPFNQGDSSTSANTASDGIDASTPWVAAADGNLEALKVSLEHLKMSASVADENGYTLVQAAASYGHMNVLSWLLSSHQAVNINAADNEGDTALHYAATADAAKVLVEAGIDPHIRNRAGKTALESKRDELQESMADEDFDEEDEEYVALQSLVSYLSSVQSVPQ